MSGDALKAPILTPEEGRAPCLSAWWIHGPLWGQPCVEKGPHTKHRTAIVNGYEGEWSDPDRGEIAGRCAMTDLAEQWQQTMATVMTGFEELGRQLRSAAMKARRTAARQGTRGRRGARSVGPFGLPWVRYRETMVGDLRGLPPRGAR